jgi:hypothetical protein
MRAALLPIILMLAFPAACRNEKRWNVGEGSSTPTYERGEDDPTLLGNTVVPVRVGELGPNFAACNGEGRVRDFAGGGPLPVRAAPYEQAREKGQLAVGASFFICARSIDQRWLGIVYGQGGRADRACGVAAPGARGRDYEGPCESGWVPSAQVQFVGSIEDMPVQASQNVVQSNQAH